MKPMCQPQFINIPSFSDGGEDVVEFSPDEALHVELRVIDGLL
jgi:hypothetical protein